VIIHKAKSFSLRNGLELEVLTAVPERPRTCVVVWPCMGGAVQMYRMPVERFTMAGCACVLYNPRGHGRSAGGMEIPEALADLEEVLASRIPADIPLIIVGHSAGANAVLQFGATFRPPQFNILVAPVLDSRESLFFMYRKKTIQEFIDILCTYITGDDAVVRAVLSDEQWLSPDKWYQERYRDLLDQVPARTPIGSFLEKLFIPGHNAFQELAASSRRCLIMMAKEDSWYPAETVQRLAIDHNIQVQKVEEAVNHFFAGGWDRVWDTTMEMIIRGEPASK